MSASTQTLKQTPLRNWHQSHGAKLVPFAGWEMPLQFTKVLEEHHATRNAAGLFDIGHMGLLAFYGDTAKVCAALDAIVPQDLTGLYPSKAVYTQVLNEKGGVIDDIIVYRMPETNSLIKDSTWFIICNAGNTDAVTAWLKSHLPADLHFENIGDRYTLLALQGPQFYDILKAAGLNPQEPLPKRFHLGEYELAGQTVFLSRTGYTGEDGVEIVVSNTAVESLWEALIAKSAKPVGLAARDTLRLEAALPLHGHELDESITPLEAGLGWSVKLQKPGDFIGKQALLAQQEKGFDRHFVAFTMQQKAIARAEDKIYDAIGNEIGWVTSGSISPTLGKPIGIGYILGSEPLKLGTLISVKIRDHHIEANVCERPFYKSPALKK